MEPKKYVDRNGNVTYKIFNMLHRGDGPAYEDVNGNKTWWFNGARHRLDGPACEYANGNKLWFVDGCEYETEFEYWIAVQKYVDMHRLT